jgi:ssDNA-binding Zn-finger/Zn-ribbon topoisomerase 1
MSKFRPSGGYRETCSFQTATIIHDPDRIPGCPKCAKPMVLRTAKSGKNAGQQFWGCSGYPDCRGVVKV